jgi:hypothetical protein
VWTAQITKLDLSPGDAETYMQDAVGLEGNLQPKVDWKIGSSKKLCVKGDVTVAPKHKHVIQQLLVP